MGRGGGGGGLVSARGAPTALGKMTWGYAMAFICTSIALTIIAAQNSATTSVLDRLSDQPAQSTTIPAPAGDELLPPSIDGDALAPPRAD